MIPCLSNMIIKKKIYKKKCINQLLHWTDIVEKLEYSGFCLIKAKIT